LSPDTCSCALAPGAFTWALTVRVSVPLSAVPTSTPAISRAAAIGASRQPLSHDQLRLRRGRAGSGRSALGPACASSCASRSTSAMMRSFRATGGIIGGEAIGSASAAGNSSATSSRQIVHSAMCASNSSRSSAAIARST
jgi:hypothetical protein